MRGGQRFLGVNIIDRNFMSIHQYNIPSLSVFVRTAYRSDVIVIYHVIEH